MARSKGPTHLSNFGPVNFEVFESSLQKQLTWGLDDSPIIPLKSSKRSSDERAEGPLLSDFWSNPQFIARVRALEQTKFRQGYRNARDINDNEVYSATPEERVALLDLKFQKDAMREALALARVEELAAPYSLAIGMNGNYYKVSIKNLETGGYATREIARRDYNGNTAGETEITLAIRDMKRELEATSKPPKPMPKVFLEPAPKTVIEKFNEDLLKAAAKREKPEVKVTDKRAATGRPITCPDHGNPMEPDEPGVLKCPINGCNKVARKKNYGAALKKPDPEPAPQSSIPAGRTMSEVVKEVVLSEAQAKPEASAGFPTEVPGPQLPMHYFIKSDAPVRLFIAPDGRMYLYQIREGYLATAIDITSANPNFIRHVSRIGPAEITLILKNIRD